MLKLVVASRNRKKTEELEALLRNLPLRVRGAGEDAPDVVEDGETFAENAGRKARAFALATGRFALADDSGLVVPALGGAPGVRSARFAGEGADDAANLRKLLEAMAGLPAARRSARFVCALALADPSGAIVFACEESCEGRILDAPRGTGGFGYDPVFFFPPLGKAFAELEPADKAAVSHRGRAMRRLRDALPALLRSLEAARRT